MPYQANFLHISRSLALIYAKTGIIHSHLKFVLCDGEVNEPAHSYFSLDYIESN